MVMETRVRVEALRKLQSILNIKALGPLAFRFKFFEKPGK
jgi:hypothetical protein